MVRELRQRMDDILRAVSGDEEAFNRFAEAERLGVYLRHGQIYSAAIGQSHTARLANELLSGGCHPQKSGVRQTTPSRTFCP